MEPSVRVIKNKIPQVRKAVARALDFALRETAVELETEIKLEIRSKDIIDTGNLMNSVYVAFHDKDKRPSSLMTGLVFSRRRGKKVKVDNKLAERIPLPRENEAVVGVAANYGVYIEMGTVSSSARPFVAPAVDRIEPEFARKVKAILDADLRRL